MSDYKTAKEAFVAGNAGTSLYNINAVSLAALASYTLYAAFSCRFASSPLIDYLSIVLPLLFSITILSSFPLTFNATLLLLALAVYVTKPSPTYSRHLNGFSPEGDHPKSAGSWLDESDSDEEPVEPTVTRATPLKLPSQMIISAPSSSSSPISPSPSSLSVAEETPNKRTWKRRHSPTPSTHSHTAIDILPTPEFPSSTTLTNHTSTYPTRSKAGKQAEKDKLPFLSVYRAHMMIMTVHAILAVDFGVFPRWQGKCEDFGTSLMDVGVGSFVFSLGIVSSRTFSSPSSTPLFASIFSVLKKSAPVLLLGLIRVVMVKGSDYPEHVTEYGVHWNFFFTLGLLPVLGTLLFPIRQNFMRWSIMGLVISAVHQGLLKNTRLQGWVLSEARIGLVGMNKEGLVSLPGYLAIFLLGLSTGGHILRSASPVRSGPKSDASQTQSHYEKRRVELALVLFSYSIAWWGGLGVCRLLGGEVSRRLSNLPYVLWVAGYNTSFLLGYLVLEIALFPSSDRAVPPLLEAINSNSLSVFLIANLLTGAINLSVQTMYASRVVSMGILVGYSVAICGIAWAARTLRLKL
ncbi:glucosaminylphosphatidylinositol acyltransferase, partial [Tremellales sp. Uapishka_1]